MTTFARAALGFGFVMVLGWLSGCSDDPRTGPKPIRVRTVSVAPVDPELAVGAQIQLTATAKDTLNNVITDQPVVWASQNTTVATVSATGLVTAHAPGEAPIRAVVDGVTGTANVVVTPPQILVVSDPSLSGEAPRGGTSRAAAAATAADVAFISLAPGTVPNGKVAVILSPRMSSSISVAMTDGGFDAVPVPALAGDEVTIEVTGKNSSVFSAKVPSRRRPTVVRTVPPRGKTDVPTNSAVLLAFSEPIDGATLSSSDIQLFRGTSAIPGSVRLLAGAKASVVLEPSVALDPNVSYRLEVTGPVNDFDGDLVEQGTVAVFTTGSVTFGPPDNISVWPDSLEVEVGSQIQLAATVRDAWLNPIVGHAVTWRSADPSRATVSPSGLATAVAETNETKIYAEIGGGIMGYHVLIIRKLFPVASVAFPWESMTMVVGRSESIFADVTDVTGSAVWSSRPAIWWSSNPAVAVVERGTSKGGELKAVGAGTAKVALTVEGKSDTLLVTVTTSDVTAPTIVATAPAAGATGVARDTPISVTFSETIDFIRPDGPDGIPSDEILRTWLTVTGPTAVEGRFTAVGARTLTFAPSQPLEYNTTYTVRVTTGVRDLSGNRLAADHVWTFTTVDRTLLSDIVAISLDIYSSCGITSAGAAYCWPGPQYTWPTQGYTPAVPVAAGLNFTALSVGVGHTCGITTAGATYCWGSNEYGQLGDGTTIGRGTPAPVAGGLSFASVSAGFSHTCALTTAGAAYCWGQNGYGQLGDPTATPIGSTTPVPVAGGLTFASLDVGADYTCAATTAGAAYCWGANFNGQLGDGTTVQRSGPVSVAGGLSFTLVSADNHTCGITSAGAAYCWGSNFAGQLGNGTTTASLTPVPVTGGLSFAALVSGGSHTCGLTLSGSVYCWGSNWRGLLGDGTTTDRLTPVPVIGGLTFSAVDASAVHSCGMTAAGAVYCWGRNSEGQLGNGYTTDSSVPVRVMKAP